MIIVVGAGPAGLSAALSAAESHAKVILIDGASRLGGQFWRHSSVEQLDANGAVLISAVAKHPNIEILSGAKIWRADYQDGESTLHVLIFGKSRELKTRKLILATGAYDRTLPFPGWDIPGVMTAGAAQALLKGSGVIAGKKIVIAGTGPFLLPVAVGLANSGANIVGLFEANRRTRWIRHLWVLLRNLPKVFLALAYGRELRAHKLRLKERFAVIEAKKGADGLLESVRVSKVNGDFSVKPGTDFNIKCDALAVGWGFTADLSIAGNLGIRCEKSVDGSISVAVDGNQATSVEGIWAAGEITGIGGADLAQTEGALAGLAAAGNLQASSSLVKLRSQQRRFAEALSDAYPVGPQWKEWLTSSTLVCRCEEVSLKDIEVVVDNLGATDARSAKLLTRVGMGLCQGRICSRSFEAIVESKTGIKSSDQSSINFGNRPIITPITFQELVESTDLPDVRED